jgi:hypothetical protein
MKTKVIRYSWRGNFGHFTTATVAILVSGYAQATLAGDPALFMQSATIKGAANALTLRRVPAQDADGKITYKDISMRFDVDAFGNVTLNTDSVKITPSPTLKVGEFKQGTYNGYHACDILSPPRCDATFKVGSPGVGSGGRISGSIQRISGRDDDEFSASWTSGPIAGHPHEAKLNEAGITSTAYNWGVMGTAGSHTQNSGWKAGDIIGAVQAGGNLTLVNFANDNKADSTLAFTLCPTADPC